MGTNLKLKKQRWFELGAANYSLVRPAASDVPVYPCPICLTPFTRDALEDGRLTAEDVPPKSLGGRPWLLTCKTCNNLAGMSIDADAKDHEGIREAMAGRDTRRAEAIVGDRRIRGEVDFKAGQFRVRPDINPPDTSDYLRQTIAVGTQIQVDTKPRSELGKNISWLKAGYLIMVGEYGFKIAFDPAMDIVRSQIMEIDERKMVTFLREEKHLNPLLASTIAICRVLQPADHRGWVVIIGRFLLDYPLRDDMTLYDRLARYADNRSYGTSLKVMAKPTVARFGFALDSPEFSSAYGAEDANESSD